MTESLTDLIERLRNLDACAISDALDQLGEPNAVALGLSALTVRKRIAGIVLTVQLGPRQAEGSVRHLCTSAIDAADGSHVIVVANGGRTDVGSWGGTLSLGAVRQGLQGVVLDGASRDIDEAMELELPVYGRAGVPRTARGRIVELDWNVPVRISEVIVSPGDLVVADGSGVVFLRRGVAAAAISLAERIVAKERLMAEAIRLGAPMSEVMGANYEQMLDQASDVP